MTYSRDDADKKAGFAVGKRVWLAQTWDGAVLLARALGQPRSLILASDKPDSYGRLRVALDDGTETRVRKDLLRLSPPPSLSGRNTKAKETKPKPRKEAIRPETGVELTVFDVLEN